MAILGAPSRLSKLVRPWRHVAIVSLLVLLGLIFLGLGLGSTISLGLGLGPAFRLPRLLRSLRRLVRIALLFALSYPGVPASVYSTSGISTPCHSRHSDLPSQPSRAMKAKPRTHSRRARMSTHQRNSRRRIRPCVSIRPS